LLTENRWLTLRVVQQGLAWSTFVHPKALAILW